jgi:hypothetical protein
MVWYSTHLHLLSSVSVTLWSGAACSLGIPEAQLVVRRPLISCLYIRPLDLLFTVGPERSQFTYVLQTFFEPVNPDHNNDNINEAEIANYR